LRSGYPEFPTNLSLIAAPQPQQKAATGLRRRRLLTHGHDTQPSNSLAARCEEKVEEVAQVERKPRPLGSGRGLILGSQHVQLERHTDSLPNSRKRKVERYGYRIVIEPCRSHLQSSTKTASALPPLAGVVSLSARPLKQTGCRFRILQNKIGPNLRKLLAAT
jgi:hypothetical protein